MKIFRCAITFFYTLAIYLGLPLLGWGFDDLPGFFAFPQLVGYAISIAAFGLLAAYMIQRPGGMGNTLGKGQDIGLFRASALYAFLLRLYCLVRSSLCPLQTAAALA